MIQKKFPSLLFGPPIVLCQQHGNIFIIYKSIAHGEAPAHGGSLAPPLSRLHGSGRLDVKGERPEVHWSFFFKWLGKIVDSKLTSKL